MGKIVAAHLGSGVSACAIHQGRSVDSTMGFTALEACPWARGRAGWTPAWCCG